MLRLAEVYEADAAQRVSVTDFDEVPEKQCGG